MSPVSVIGIVFFFGGFCALYILLANRRALNKSKQLGMLGEILRGEHGPSPRKVLIIAFCAQFFGMCTTFAGVMKGDAERAERCRNTCNQRHYAKGKIQGSQEKTNGRHAFVACVCSEGPSPDPLELPAQ